MDLGEKLEEEGQHIKWAPEHGEHDDVIDSALALQVEQLESGEGRVHSPQRLQHRLDFRTSSLCICRSPDLAFSTVQ